MVAVWPFYKLFGSSNDSNEATSSNIQAVSVGSGQSKLPDADKTTKIQPAQSTAVHDDIRTFKPAESPFERVRWMYTKNKYGFISYEGAVVTGVVSCAFPMGLAYGAFYDLRMAHNTGQLRSFRHKLHVFCRGGFIGSFWLCLYSGLLTASIGFLGSSKNSLGLVDIVNAFISVGALYGAIEHKGFRGAAIYGGKGGIVSLMLYSLFLGYQYGPNGHLYSLDDVYQRLRNRYWHAQINLFLEAGQPIRWSPSAALQGQYWRAAYRQQNAVCLDSVDEDLVDD